MLLKAEVCMKVKFSPSPEQPLAPEVLQLLGDSQASHDDGVPSAHPQSRRPPLSDQALLTALVGQTVQLVLTALSATLCTHMNSNVNQ